VTGNSQQYTHDGLKQAVGSASGWSNISNKLQQSAGSGNTPNNFDTVAQTAEKMYTSLSGDQKQAIDSMPTDVQISVFEFLGYLNNLSQDNRQQAQQIAQFVSNCTAQASTPTPR
jgi:hypothetical protein